MAAEEVNWLRNRRRVQGGKIVLDMKVRARLNALMDYMEKMSVELVYTPYYQAVPVVKGSFNSRHVEGLFTITAEDLKLERYEHIRQLVEMNQDYICGFNMDSRCQDDEEFTVELLFPDYSFYGTPRRGQTDDFLDMQLHRCFNAPMVIDCIRYAKEVLCGVWENPEFYNILQAPCFLRNVAEIWSADMSWQELVDEAYLQNYIKRYD